MYTRLQLYLLVLLCSELSVFSCSSKLFYFIFGVHEPFELSAEVRTGILANTRWANDHHCTVDIHPALSRLLKLDLRLLDLRGGYMYLKYMPTLTTYQS